MPLNTYYYSSINDFLLKPTKEILGEITSSETYFEITPQSIKSWEFQIKHLKTSLNDFSEGSIFFEFNIPRMGKRADVVIIIQGLVIILEYKVGASSYDNSFVDQALDYGLDLKNFHEGSHNKLIVPILVSTNADDYVNNFELYEDNLLEPLKANESNLEQVFKDLVKEFDQESLFDVNEWINSSYKPTPTIIEAAQALYEGHDVKEISRSDAGAINLSLTSEAISKVIQNSRDKHSKSICFVTGVPGAGKTLAGLNIATDKSNDLDESKKTVFLSGNGPLVIVLNEALARDKVKKQKRLGTRITKASAKREVKKFIQNIHHFRDNYLIKEDEVPYEKVVIFDEAQRAWNQNQLEKKMREKGHEVQMSEPEFLLEVMDRHLDWCVVICLVGGGQEINRGEAGLSPWVDTLEKKYSDWDVYFSDEIDNEIYSWGQDLSRIINSDRSTIIPDLHLSVSVRSFRSENVSAFVNEVIKGNEVNASLISESLEEFPICITRDLNTARDWLKQKARGSERYGLVADSNAIRLKPEGIFVKTDIDPANWFLNDKNDVRSSFYMEDTACEFDIQGLELDWVGICWDAGMRWNDDLGWELFKFSGTKWQERRIETEKKYLLNAYRVLLTRARQGQVIFVPNNNYKMLI